MKRFLLLVLTAMLFSVTAFGQVTTGRLNGTISGPDGVLPNATVVARDNTSGKEVTTTTKGDGTYLFSQLEFGEYTVRVSAAGFKGFVANKVKIDVGRDYTLDQTLQIGDVQETVTITAGADVVTSTTAQVSNTVSPKQILELPLLTRNPLALTTLQPGVASNPFQNTSINGMRTTFTNITRDGINIQDTFIRSNATDFAPGRPSVDDTGEFTISTSNQEADQGYGGAQIRLVTPRGTKEFHGALFAYNRNSGFAANSFFRNRNSSPLQNEKPSFRNRNQYGGKISGPLPLPSFGEGGPYVVKNKAFFFGSYEGIKDPISGLNGRTILTPSARNGAFTYTRGTLGAAINTTVGTATVSCPARLTSADPSVNCTVSSILGFAQGLGFAGIPSTINPVIMSRIISNLPTTSNVTGGDGLNTAGFSLTRRSDQTRNTYTTRLDYDATEKDSFNGVYSFNREANLRPDADTTAFTPIPGVNQFSANTTFVLAYRRIFSSNIVNEARGGIFKSDVPFDRTTPTPQFYIGGSLVTVPENTFQAQGRFTQGVNFQDNVDWVAGRHSVRFGGQIQYFKVDAYNDAGIVPTYNLGSISIPGSTTNFTTANFSTLGGISTTQLGTANSLLSLLAGTVSSGSQQFNLANLQSGFAAERENRPYRYSNHSLFLSDRWSAASGLTLTLGLRYELFPAMRLDNGLALEPLISNIDNVLPSLLQTNGSYVALGTNSGNIGTYHKTDFNNFAPNVGVAYSPSFESGIGNMLFGERGKTVIRAGYSHIYGNDSIVTSLNNAAVGNAGLARTTSSALGPLSTTQLNDRLGISLTAVNPPVFIAPPRTYLQNNTASFGNFGTVYAIDPKIQSPMVEQYSFGFQREFFGNTALEIRYVGSRSDSLVRASDYNQIDIFSNGFLADFNRARQNLATGGSAFCTTTGCQALTIFQNTNTPQAGRLVVGTGGVALTTFNNNLVNGTPADLALNWVTLGLNNHPTVASPNNVPFVKLLPNPGTGVIDLLENDAFHNYNSLQVEVRRRLSKGLYMQANYTFSKNLTNAVGTSQALFDPYLDINNKDLDRQRADFDQTHVFNLNSIYELPFGKGKALLNYGGVMDKVFGGWQVSGIMTWSTGAPISFVDSRGTYNRSGRSGRQSVTTGLTGDQLKDLVGIFEQNGRIYWINPSIINTAGQASAGYGSTPFAGQVFFNVEPGQTGSLGRTLLNGPNFMNVNMAVLKNIKFGEGATRLQLRGEAFNLFNNVNLFNNTQFANINSTTFGQITSGSGGREVQFAVRFEF